jgi:photosystem II stability/assembly factor-like uncharacterized protein
MSSTGGDTTAVAGDGNSSGGSAGAQVAPPHVVTACDKLAKVGVWEQITPPGIDLSTFGSNAVILDPTNTSNVYVGTNSSGLFKSTDCGATWVHQDTGTLGADIDKGDVFPVLDPINPDTLYTGSLYGTNGFFKSTDGGKNWTQKLPPDIAQYVPYGGFVGGIAMDPGPAPNANLHLIVTWHDVCKAPYLQSCYGETTDGAEHWTLHNGDPSWSGMEGAVITFLDSDRWLFGSQANGLWTSNDHGKSWKKIPGVEISHSAGQLYRAKSGAFFLGAGLGILYSPDGASWTNVPNSGTFMTGVVGDGNHIWTSSSFPYNPPDRPAPYEPYMIGSEADPMTWKTFESPKMSSGGYTAYDPDHKLLYSANYWEGVWRVVVE